MQVLLANHRLVELSPDEGTSAEIVAEVRQWFRLRMASSHWWGDRNRVATASETVPESVPPWQAVADDQGLGEFSRHMFRLFVTLEAAERSTRPADNAPCADGQRTAATCSATRRHAPGSSHSARFVVASDRLVEPSEDVTALAGHLLFKRWLFVKEQESNVEQDPVAVDLLFAEAQADIAAGR